MTEQTPNPRTTRQLTLEVWYPAALANGQVEHTVYTDVLGSGPDDPKRPNTPFQFNGRAARDAAPLIPVRDAAPFIPARDAAHASVARNSASTSAADALAAGSASAPAWDVKYPLVIVSHGYPGSRLQMSYLTENLASKGYVVVAIDHPESTRADTVSYTHLTLPTIYSV